MAYPTVNAPYGLKPINLIGGQVFAGQTRELPIASGYGTAIYNGDIVGVEIPASVELEITETEPGIQGDRVSGARKPATLQTGKVIQVPLFVNIGDRVKVDTRTGDYIARV